VTKDYTMKYFDAVEGNLGNVGKKSDLGKKSPAQRQTVVMTMDNMSKK